MRVALITTGDSIVRQGLIDSGAAALSGVFDFDFEPDTGVDAVRSFVRSAAPDLAILYKVPLIIPQDIIELPTRGMINIHPSLLPMYRGANPWFWVYRNMETRSGVTIHKVDRCADRGDILAQGAFDIICGEHRYGAMSRADRTAWELLSGVLGDYRRIVPVAQPSGLWPEAPAVKDYKSAIDLGAISGINVWHILRGFPELLCSLAALPFGEDYGIGDFVPRSDGEASAAGSLVKTDDDWRLACRDGYIVIKSR